MLKTLATVVGVILLLAGVGIAIAHYLIESTIAAKFITLALAALLLVGGWALFAWGRRASGERGKDWSQRNGQE